DGRDPARRLLRAARDPDRVGARDARRRRPARHRPGRPRGAGGDVLGGEGGGRLDLAPAAEDEAAEREAESERPDGEAADRHGLPRSREPLPAAERLVLLGRQLLAAALLAQRTAGAQTEVEVVEDLR